MHISSYLYIPCLTGALGVWGKCRWIVAISSLLCVYFRVVSTLHWFFSYLDLAVFLHGVKWSRWTRRPASDRGLWLTLEHFKHELLHPTQSSINASYLYGPMAAGADVVLIIFLLSPDMFSCFSPQTTQQCSDRGKWITARQLLQRPTLTTVICREERVAFLNERQTWKWVALTLEELQHDRCRVSGHS